jgi:hypothetical protein
MFVGISLIGTMIYRRRREAAWGRAGARLTGRDPCVYSTMGNIMGMRHPFRGSWAVVSASAAIGLAGPLRADLAPASPFLPANAAAAGGAAAPAGPIELRGLMPTPDGLAFCIYDTAKKKDVWVGLNETGHDFVIRSADPGTDSIKVDYQGRSMKLTLKTAKIASAGPANAAPTLVTQQSLSAPGVSPNPADEQKRLDAVAQEVRRRRQEREKAAQDAQNSQPAPPAR